MIGQLTIIVLLGTALVAIPFGIVFGFGYLIVAGWRALHAAKMIAGKPPEWRAGPVYGLAGALCLGLAWLI